MRRSRSTAAALALALVLGAGACGGDDGGAAATSTSGRPERTTSSTGSGSTAAGEVSPLVDDAIVAAGTTATDQLFKRHGEVSADLYREMVVRTCAEVATGQRTGRAAADTAAAIVGAVPDGPELRNYEAGMLLLAQYYLVKADCGAGADYAGAVRSALVPFQTEAVDEGR